MKKEQLKEITDRLELLTEREREVLIGELDAMLEKKKKRESLFEAVKFIIHEIGDISIKNQHGGRTGIGTNLIYDESKNENVSLCYMLDSDQLELVQNDETILTITKDSPILEAFRELFRELELEE